MARSKRVETAGGWYHVSNRGAGRQRIFRNDEHRVSFLELLGSLREQHRVEVHAYCMMTNRYDLILRTLRANLSMAMRHLGGVYTQRYNRMTGRDGPLFRGRFRAVLFEPETTLLAVSRHLHRRPLVTGTVQRLDRYRWSSYPSYVTTRRQPPWLQRSAILEMTDGNARSYRQYVEREGESNELVRRFYRQSRPGSILGSDAFKRQMVQAGDPAGGGPPEVVDAPIPPRRVIRLTADYFEVTRRSLLTSTRGRLNRPRMAALWLCRRHSRQTLEQLAELFRVSSFGTVSAALHRAKTALGEEFWRDVRAIERQLRTD
ncbi:MAG: hypothetical protein AAF736_06330 [Pseudomonadota bacterium]